MRLGGWALWSGYTKRVWHNIEAMEPNSVIFECKRGPFVEHEVEGVLEV